MTALLRAELRKVLGTRLALGLLLGALAIVVLALGFTLWGPTTPGMEVEGAPRSVESASDVLSLLGVTNAVTLFALVFGVTFATAEHRHRTAGTTFLVEPRRWRVVAAKGLAVAVVGIVYALVTLAVAMLVLGVYVLVEGIDLPIDGEVAQFLGMSVAVTVLNALIGLGVGAALRSQVGAIVAVLVWLFVAESLLAGLLPSVARWTPFAAGNDMLVAGSELGLALATTVAVGWTALALVVGGWLTEHRDTV